MRPGDFIITPSWAFHDHGNPGDEPVVWLDGLDIPLVRTLDAGFAERHPEETQPVVRPEGDTLARYAMNLLPVEHRRTSSAARSSSTRTSAAARRSSGRGGPRPGIRCHGLKMQYADPTTGGYPMATIASFIQLLPAGFTRRTYRSTDATVFCVVEGRGRTRVGEQTFDWGPRDIFVAPSWSAVSHEARGDAVLFSFSDPARAESPRLWREVEST